MCRFKLVDVLLDLEGKISIKMEIFFFIGICTYSLITRILTGKACFLKQASGATKLLGLANK